MVPLLTIDGEPTVCFDVKSCLLQLHLLMQKVSFSGNEDFYTYKGLEDISRQDMKLLVQCLVNNSSINSARCAFTHHYKNVEGSQFKKLTNEKFSSIVRTMINERPYFENLFLKPNHTKKIIRKESDYFIDVMEILLKKNLHFIYRFDALIVKDSDKEEVEVALQEIAFKYWNKKITLSIE